MNYANVGHFHKIFKKREPYFTIECQFNFTNARWYKKTRKLIFVDSQMHRTLENIYDISAQHLQEKLASDQITIEHQTTNRISNQILLIKNYINIPPTAQSLEEQVLFNYVPIGTGEHGVFITYLPDVDKSTNKQKIIIQVLFGAEFFNQWDVDTLARTMPFDARKALEQAFSLHLENRSYFDTLDAAATNPAASFTDSITKYHAAIALLKYTLNGLITADDSNSFPACSFLNNNQEREKILTARDIIHNNLTTPLTIRELAKKCGMNECYLKKGFKAMFNKTIYEYREHERIKKSQELILSQKMNINEVAIEMGYASHAYFSTAFKKITGIKPCDLLQ